MKTWLKILFLAMALLMLLTAFVGCNNSKDPEDDTDDDYYDEDESDGEDYVFPDVEKKNYNADFTMYLFRVNNFSEYYVIDESRGTPMDEAVYARQEKVKKWLGVELVNRVDDTLGWKAYYSIVQDAVLNRDGTLDMMLSHYNGAVDTLVAESLLKDLNELQGVDLDAEYWNASAMDSLELKGHRYLGYGDCNILTTYVITFNKGMLDKYSSADVLGGKTLYDMVRDYEWTFDKMISIANLVSYIDSDSDGIKSVDDTYGFAASPSEPYISLIHAAGMNIMEQDASGAYKIALNGDKYQARLKTLIDKLSELSKSENSFLSTKIARPHDDTTAPKLASGKVLMSIYDTTHLTDYLSTKGLNFGVLPLPMFDSAQRQYRALQYGGYICIPVYLKNEQMVGETLEMYNFYSSNVEITFYEKVLGRQVADAPDDAEMLELVRNNVCTDVGFTYQHAGTPQGYGEQWQSVGGCVYNLTQPGYTGGGLSSWFAKYVSVQQNGFDKFYKDIK